MDVPTPHLYSEDGDNLKLSDTCAFFHIWGSAVILGGHGGWGKSADPSKRSSVWEQQ